VKHQIPGLGHVKRALAVAQTNKKREEISQNHCPILNNSQKVNLEVLFREREREREPSQKFFAHNVYLPEHHLKFQVLKSA
jgi:hypothetical protein